MPQSITVGKLYARMRYELQMELVTGEGGLDRRIEVAEVNRPGLALCGYYDYFAYDRIQVLGNGEISYLQTLTSHQRSEIFERFLSYEIPCIVITRGLPIPEELTLKAGKADIPVFSSSLATPVFTARLHLFLEEEFGPYEVVHGDLMEIFGIGVLILGESGIGKSECALDLIRRGHRLIADDAVLLKRVTGHRIFGTSANPHLRRYMEVRGVGIIDVVTLFGVTALRRRKRVELVVTLERWDENKEYNRSGLDEDYYFILGERLPHVTIPVQPGRNTSIVVEVAAMNLRAKKMGIYSAKQLEETLIERMTGDRALEEPIDIIEEDWGEDLEI
ncbi:HPr(Ser) kinase/phosphatase [Candidatus Poribacteria bacterium]|nr:HPr(Ser) kinase/phosphatase [Candidatus Poribacteria bacterium]